MKINLGFAGYYRIEAAKAIDGVEVPGSRRVVADWFPNLVTNGGLNAFGNDKSLTSLMQYCYVGGSNTVPQNTDSTLISYIAQSNTQIADVWGSGSAPEYSLYRNITFRFAAGVATGNLSEVGVGYASHAGSGFVLWSRALILNELGVPATITVLADEFLDIMYQLRVYPYLSDVGASINIGGVSHSVLLRAGKVTPGNTAYGWDVHSGMASAAASSSTSGNQLGAFSGTTVLGTYLQDPSGGTKSGITDVIVSPYINGSFYRQVKFTAQLSQANFGNGIAVFQCKFGPTLWKLQFSPPIPKTSLEKFSVDLGVHFARYTP